MEEEVVVLDAHRNIRDIPREEFLTFKKATLKNDDVGYVSKRGEFFRCDVCSKYQKKQQSKDAHEDYCKQSVKYKVFLNVFSAKVLSLGYPSLSDYIALKYSGRNEPFISPPRRLGLTSNELTPPD